MIYSSLWQALEPTATLLSEYGGWGLSVILMGTIAFLYKQLSEQHKLIIQRYETTITDLAREIGRLADSNKK